MSDWTFALLFRPDIVKVDLDSEQGMIHRDLAAGADLTSRIEDGAR